MFPICMFLDVEIDDQQRLVLTIESGQMEGCPARALAYLRSAMVVESGDAFSGSASFR
jgi:hypothetical protein